MSMVYFMYQNIFIEYVSPAFLKPPFFASFICFLFYEHSLYMNLCALRVHMCKRFCILASTIATYLSTLHTCGLVSIFIYEYGINLFIIRGIFLLRYDYSGYGQSSGKVGE